MGIFSFLKRKKADDKKSDLEKRLVTEAVDPTKLPKDQVQSDLEKLNVLDETLKESKNLATVGDSQESVRDDSIEEALKIENPFVGK